ncbi:hypothetical protein BZG02_10875 [Labilibaculum filiforme]|uniref:Uncharacterized protein n=1 Tax=Labilibaculum filiforme TaxID=1940526 RepID=A0A2N3HXD4_9BACT|nr:hypothetical protein [Labilibaculum filiforme]PKQ62708.1 hypothetical protein BZG02_10875 [Labilibaculum filiforme]
MKNLAELDNSYPSFSEMKLSNKEMNLLAGGRCESVCYKQCTTKKKTTTVKIECGNKKKASALVQDLPNLAPEYPGEIGHITIIHP